MLLERRLLFTNQNAVMRGWMVDGGTGLCSALGVYVESLRLFKLLVSLSSPNVHEKGTAQIRKSGANI